MGLTGSQDHTIRVFRADDGVGVYTLHGHTGPISSLFIDRLSPSTAGSASVDGLLCVWDLLTGACIHGIQVCTLHGIQVCTLHSIQVCTAISAYVHYTAFRYVQRSGNYSIHWIILVCTTSRYVHHPGIYSIQVCTLYSIQVCTL